MLIALNLAMFSRDFFIQLIVSIVRKFAETLTLGNYPNCISYSLSLDLLSLHPTSSCKSLGQFWYFNAIYLTQHVNFPVCGETRAAI